MTYTELIAHYVRQGLDLIAAKDMACANLSFRRGDTQRDGGQWDRDNDKRGDVR